MDTQRAAEWDRRHQAGETWRQIGESEGLHGATIKKQVLKWRHQDGQTTVYENGLAEESPPVLFPDLRTRTDEEAFADRYLDLVIEQQELEESQRNEQDVAHVVIPDDRPIGLVFSGDWHLGNKHTDHKALKEHLEHIRTADGVYMVGMGDYADWFIGRMVRLAVTEQQYKPAQQRVIARDLLLRKTGGKALAFLAGNHCWKPEELTGEDPVADIAAEAKIPYLGYGGVLYIRLGDVEYKVSLWHSYPGGSAINPGNNNRRLRADYENLDVNCLGHFHMNYAQDGTTKEGRDYVDLRSGSFKVRDARYAAMKVGAKGGDPRMPMAVLFPKEKRVWHIRDYREWLPLLKWLRGS